MNLKRVWRIAFAAMMAVAVGAGVGEAVHPVAPVSVVAQLKQVDTGGDGSQDCDGQDTTADSSNCAGAISSLEY